jgi:hypothetical protein
MVKLVVHNSELVETASIGKLGYTKRHRVLYSLHTQIFSIGDLLTR